MNVLVAAMDFLCRNMLFVVLLTIAGYCKNAKRAKAQFAESSMASKEQIVVVNIGRLLLMIALCGYGPGKGLSQLDTVSILLFCTLHLC